MAAKLTAEQKALKAACVKLAKATQGCVRLDQATKDRYYRECEKLGKAAA